MKRSIIVGVLGTLIVAGVVTACVLLIGNEENPEDNSVSTTESPADEDKTPTLEMLDAMQQLMTGQKEFNRTYFAELQTCMDTFHPLLVSYQDTTWQRIIDYWLSDGVGSDTWGCDTSPYMEDNATQTEFHNMTIYEPCNYASNVAYYHDVTEFCSKIELGTQFQLPEEYVNAFGVTFAELTVMSSFMHMSHTKLGYQQDNTGIKVIAYLLSQGNFAGLSDVSPILTDLASTTRAQTALEISNDFFNMYGTLPIDQWFDHTNNIDVPDYYITFGAIVSTALTIALPEQTVDKIIEVMINMFSVDPEIVDFLTLEYIPELRTLFANVEIDSETKSKFGKDVLSALVKLIYSFLWQEEKLTDNAIFLNPHVNKLGAKLLPIINEKVNAINYFEYFEHNFQIGENIYPGDTWCNPIMPHAKWHLESGIGLLDLVYVGDEMYKIITKYVQQ